MLDRLQTKEVLRATLHAILFHRLFGTVRPRTFEVLDVTMVSEWMRGLACVRARACVYVYSCVLSSVGLSWVVLSMLVVRETRGLEGGGS